MSETRYTEDHEWAALDGDIITIGITDYAQSQLGDIVYVELPEVGRTLDQGEETAVVESVKAAGDVTSPVTGEVIEVDAKEVIIKLADEVEGILKASDISRDRVEDARNSFKVGDSVEAKITSVDRKNRGVVLSIKAKDYEDEKEAVKSLKESEQETASPGTIGDLIKAQMGDN